MHALPLVFNICMGIVYLILYLASFRHYTGVRE